MKFFKTLFWFTLLLLPIALVFILLQSVEKAPLIADAQSLTTPNVERAKALLREHDPRRLKDKETKTIVLSEQELRLVANHLIQRFSSGGVDIGLGENEIAVQASVAIPGLQPTYYFNVDSLIRAEDKRLSFERLKIGKLSVPKSIATSVGKFILMHAYRSVGIPASRDLVKGIEVSPARLAVTYQWQQQLIDVVRERLISPTTVTRLREYNDALVTFGEESNGERTLNELLTYLCNAVAAESDAITDNRALILSLSNYINGRRMSSLIPAVKQWPRPKKVKITAQGRHDLAQHFATSAALVIAGGRDVSDAIGLYKEIDDSAGGSGFSFKDLAADRAGTQFAQIATASSSSASYVRTRLSSPLKPYELIPDLTGLEEKMTDAEFKARYGGVEDARYLSVVAEIDRRISQSPLFKDK